MSIFEFGSRKRRLLTLGLSGFALLAIGGFTGAALSHVFRPPVAMAPLHTVAIHSLASSNGIVAIRGRVAERFGNRMVIDDGTGRTLIETGPRADEASSVALGAVVTVQGRYEGDAFRPGFIVMPSGTVMPLGPMVGPHVGHRGPREPHEEEVCAPPPGAPLPAVGAPAKPAQ